jgi:uncharacterized protein (DUF1800 family)
MSLLPAFHAVSRFGLGARDNEIELVSNDPKGWLKGQLRNAYIPDEVKERVGGNDLTLKAIRAAKKNKSGDAQEAMVSMKDIYIKETGNRFLAQLRSKQPFVERMVMFWSNHFSVSIQKHIVTAMVNAYEVEAIRPHINGYFKDLLIAAESHPAMLFYLDNVQSFGPDSRAGMRRGKGINENLAREIMELHTLGVNGGYTQKDVIEFARILTGWTLETGIGGPMIKYAFQPRVHEPGSKTLLGRTFPENGEQEGIDALTMLANHPATAKHISTKLAKHFISDNPSYSAIQTITNTFINSGGHLPSVMSTIIELDETWQKPLSKIKNPYEFTLSAMRATDVEPPQKKIIGSLEALDYRTFNADSPAGYPDNSESWASSDAIMKRIEWAHTFSQRISEVERPLDLAQNIIGPVMSENTRQTIARAASGRDGLAFLFSSPEFLRR